MFPGAVGILQTVVERMLRRQKRYDTFPGRIVPEVGNEMSEVLLLPLTHRAVREKHVCVVSCESTDCMIRVDPGFDTGGRVELGSGRPKLNRGCRIRRG